MTYGTRGVELNLPGIDHSLFVLALLLIVSDWRKLVAASAAFTMAHTVTLALATNATVYNAPPGKGHSAEPCPVRHPRG